MAWGSSASVRNTELPNLSTTMDEFTPLSAWKTHASLSGRREEHGLTGSRSASGHKKTRSPKLKQVCFALAVFLTRPQAELKSAQGGTLKRRSRSVKKGTTAVR